jgi:predicted methyltransferase
MAVRISAVLLLMLSCVGSAAAESSADRFAAQVAERLEVSEGSVVADIGAGDGSYAIAISQVVGPTGTVYATELEEEDRADIQREVNDASVPHIQVMKAEIESTGLPAASCDAVYLRRVYHHITSPEPFDRSLFETIRPGGRLAIVDFRPTWWLALFTPEGIPEDRGGHGIQPALVVKELEAAGFKHIETHEEWDPDSWFNRDFGVIFERPTNGS